MDEKKIQKNTSSREERINSQKKIKDSTRVGDLVKIKDPTGKFGQWNRVQEVGKTSVTLEDGKKWPKNKVWRSKTYSGRAGERIRDSQAVLFRL